jgi:GNAT superfamily N-acetyltransferase
MAGRAFAHLGPLDRQRPASLRDGSSVTIRRCRSEDESALSEFLNGLCLDARRLRFFTGGVDVARSARSSVASAADRLGLIAFDERGQLVGHVLCIELGDRRAEMAVEVADRLHGQGLGTILIERLAEIAERHGVTTFVAEVLPDNRAMLEVLRDGFDASVCWQEGVDHVEFATSSWRLARERFP